MIEVTGDSLSIEEMSLGWLLSPEKQVEKINMNFLAIPQPVP